MATYSLNSVFDSFPLTVVNGISVNVGAEFPAHELIAAGQPVPQVVIVDLHAQVFAPKLENYLFYQLFCAAAADGIGGELGRVNRRIMTYERGGVRVLEEDLTQRSEILKRARARGFSQLLTPSAPTFLCRRLTVFVPDESQRQRVYEVVRNVFITRDREYFAERVKMLQDGQPDGARLSDSAIARITQAFDQARSFVSSPGLFYEPHANGPCSEETIDQKLIRTIINVQLLGDEPVKVASGEKAIEVRRSGEEVQITDPATGETQSLALALPPARRYRHWRPKCVGILREVLAQTDDHLRLVNFGTGDALYVGSGEDFTHFALVRNGRMLLADPSETTIGNLIELNLLEQVELIYLSHVHYDHVGGVFELACRYLRGEPVPNLRLMAARPVIIQARETLAVVTGLKGKQVDELFDFLVPDAMANSAGVPDPDGDVEVFQPPDGQFSGVEVHLMRTYAHPLPTYAIKLITPHAVLAYLVDSAMPPPAIKGRHHDRFDDFQKFFSAEAGVDWLIADAGEVEERDDNVHIAPAALARVFGSHAERGTLLTVHSPLAQKHRDLRRFEPFDVVDLLPFAAQAAFTNPVAARLLDLGAFRNRHFRIDQTQAARLARVAQVALFRKGEKILSKNEDVRDPENNKVHIILRGEVSVAEEGRAMREGEHLGPGDLFGERAIFGAEVGSLSYWQIPERRRAKVLTRHEFDSGAYFTWNPGLSEHDIEEEFEQEPGLRDALLGLFRETRKLQRTRTAVVLTGEAEVLEIKAQEFFKIFEHFGLEDADLDEEQQDEKIRETLGSLVLSAASASKKMRMDDFIALVEVGHLTQVMEPILEMATAKKAGDRERFKAMKWPETVWSNYSRIDPVSRVIDANLSAFLGFARVFHDQYVAEIEIARFLDPTLATPETLQRLIDEEALDGNSERVQAYLVRYRNAKKHVKLQRQDVLKLEPFAQAIAMRAPESGVSVEQAAQKNAARLVEFYESFPPKQDVLSSLFAEWKVLLAEIDQAYHPDARDAYKDYLARLQTKAIANILTILLYVRVGLAQGFPNPALDEILLWIHAAWSLDNDWAEQAGMTWDELEGIKPGDIKKDWVALHAVIEQLDFRSDFAPIMTEGVARYHNPL